MLKDLPTFSFGMGDRFGLQGIAQLSAIQAIRDEGVQVSPVWNKSNREHTLIGTHPSSLRQEADDAVQALGWTHPYFVDADHITLETVDPFLAASDFFTLDVSAFVGIAPAESEVDGFLKDLPHLGKQLALDGVDARLDLTTESAREAAAHYLKALQAAGILYRSILEKRESPFVVEVSIDETDRPQDPRTLFYILCMLARERIPAQTIAPKFTGRFNKGVDYVGDLAAFETEFREDLAVIRYSVRELGLESNLKLSVHSGSDKFSLYPVIRQILAETGAGIHIKTAGTTWLEELIGLAASGGSGLEIAKSVYEGAYQKRQALCEPYAAVIDIREDRLPTPAQIQQWDSEAFVAALAHEPSNPLFNPDLRQLLHVGFKIAAGLGKIYLDAVRDNSATIGQFVKHNLLERHLRPLFK